MGAWPLLTTADLDLTLNTWDLTQTLSDTLGDLGTPADGFDSYLSETVTLLSGLDNLGGSLLEDLNLAAGIAGTIDPASLNSDAASLPASLAAGDAIVADANALLGSVGPPPPASTGVVCDASTTFPDVTFGGPAVVVNGSFTNGNTTPLTLQSLVLTQDDGGPFSINPALPVTLQPGATWTFPLTIQSQPKGTWHGHLDLTTSDRTAPSVGCITVTIADTPAPPPSGGSGGGGSGGGGGGACTNDPFSKEPLPLCGQ